MCRLFGMTAGPERLQATFWLLGAGDSLVAQSHRNADGTGLGHFDEDGRPRVDKAPIAAFEDRAFAADARRVRSTTFVAHVVTRRTAA
jgi:glutamine amidotransferase